LFKKQSIQSIKADSEPILALSELDWIYFATSSNRNILIWNSQNGSLIKNLTGHSDNVYHLIKKQNGFFLSASADKTIKAWNSTDWSLIRTLKVHRDSVNCLAELNYDLFASGSQDGEIIIWNVYEWRNVRTWKAHNAPIVSLVLLPYQKYLASLYQSQEINIWDFNKGSLVKTLISNEIIYSMVALRNGNLLMASGTGLINEWDGEDVILKNTVFYGSSRNGDIRVMKF